MGSTDYSHIYYGIEPLATVYRDLCSDALIEDGNNGYNGTISTSDGIAPARDVRAPMTLAAAKAYAETALDNMSKRDAACAVPLLAADAVATRQVKVTLVLDGTQYAATQIRTANANPLDALLAAKVKLAAGERISKTNVAQKTDDSYTYDITLAWRVTPTAPKGATETRYFVSNGKSLPDWNAGFASQSAARAAAIELANDTATNYQNSLFNGLPATQTLEVISMTRRVGGAPLVSVAREVTKATIKFAVTIEKATSTTQGGWYIFGWAAS